jgi:hypothetical protein
LPAIAATSANAPAAIPARRSQSGVDIRRSLSSAVLYRPFVAQFSTN